MNKAERIQIFQDILAIKSVNGNEGEVTEYLAQLMAQHGIKSELFEERPGRKSIVAELGAGTDPRVLGFSGHADTVTVPDESKWTYPPFAGTVIEDRIYGRGAADMKGGLAAIVIALIELQDAGTLPAGRVRLLGTVGEEYDAYGAKDLTARGFSADLTGLIITEPTEGNITYAHAGALNYRVKSYGQTVHSSTPEKGINAIYNLARYVTAEQTLFDSVPVDPALGKIAHSLTIISGGDQINSIPEYAEVAGNIRPTPTFSNQAVIDLIQAKLTELNQIDGVKLELEVIHSFLPVATPKNDPFLRFVQEVGTRYFGKEPVLQVELGGTDASDFVMKNENLPVAIFGNNSFGTSHQVDEYTDIQSYFALIDSLKEIALLYFA